MAYSLVYSHVPLITRFIFCVRFLFSKQGSQDGSRVVLGLADIKLGFV